MKDPKTTDADIARMDVHDWDGTPDLPHADDYSPAECVASLDLYAARAAKARNYGMAADLTAASEMIVLLEERIDLLTAALLRPSPTPVQP